jgi:hypothetical protein
LNKKRGVHVAIKNNKHWHTISKNIQTGSMLQAHQTANDSEEDVPSTPRPEEQDPSYIHPPNIKKQHMEAKWRRMRNPGLQNFIFMEFV